MLSTKLYWNECLYVVKNKLCDFYDLPEWDQHQCMCYFDLDFKLKIRNGAS